MPTFGSLFAGIGGIDLGLERAGWSCRWQVEWDPFCQHVLAHHWPDVVRYGDIATVNPFELEQVDLIAGGFPCQPVSIAGKRGAQDDDRWLWPEFARLVRALGPRYVLVENVRNLLVVNGGSAFGEVLGDLAALGYDAEWDCIPAAAVGAPHVRDRVWIVATRSEQRWLLADADDDGRPRDAVRAGWDAAGDGGTHVADTTGERLEASGPASTGDRQHVGALTGGAGHVADTIGGRAPQRWPLGRMGRVVELDPTTADRGEAWAAEPDVGRVADGVPARLDRLHALGNAVVPQVVEVIGRRLMDQVR